MKRRTAGVSAGRSRTKHSLGTILTDRPENHAKKIPVRMPSLPIPPMLAENHSERSIHAGITFTAFGSWMKSQTWLP